MELHEKIQELRKQKNLTQEELAAVLYVSRAAVSKWESGRGYPSIDSLKAMARFFSVTVDELLSGDELLTIAEEDTRQTELRLRDLVFGLLDCAVALFFFLPIFGQTVNGVLREVPLLSLTEIAPYLHVAYLAAVIGILLTGVFTLALQNDRQSFWGKNRNKISLLLNAFASLLFIISLQPYGAAFLFCFLAIKVLMLIKWQ